jgi:hypothetical protein
MARPPELGADGASASSAPVLVVVTDIAFQDPIECRSLRTRRRSVHSERQVCGPQVRQRGGLALRSVGLTTAIRTPGATSGRKGAGKTGCAPSAPRS